MLSIHTVDGRNPAPPDMYYIWLIYMVNVGKLPYMDPMDIFNDAFFGLLGRFGEKTDVCKPR